MNSWQAALILLCTSPVIRAEKSEVLVPTPVPNPPFVAQAPVNCSWTIRFQSKNKAGEAQAVAPAPEAMMPGPAAAPARDLTEIRVAKTGDRRHIERKFSDGSSEETWFVGSLCLGEIMNQQGKTEVIAMVTPGDASSGSMPSVPSAALIMSMSGGYLAGDFPELNWIKAEHFVGMDSRDSNPVYIYRAPLPSVEGKPLAKTEVLMEARIAADSKLPVTFLAGQTLRVYKFSMETPSLELPPRFASALANYKAAWEAAKYQRLP